MTEFEGQIWAVQDNDDVNFICINKRVKRKILAISERGRELRVSEDKLLWQHPNRVKEPDDWPHKFTKIQATVNSLCEDIDVSLLWESALELELSEINDLTELYFGEEITTEHLAAIWRVLAQERFYFKRRNKDWEARSAEQVSELRTQHEREMARIKAQGLAHDWLKKLAKIPLPAFPTLSTAQNSSEENKVEEIFQVIEIPEDIIPFVERLEGWLRGDADKAVEELMSRIATTVQLTGREFAFETLQKTGRIPLDTDRDVVVGGLKSEFSALVNEAAQAVKPWQPTKTQNITQLLFSIDDEETREVDDALSIERDGLDWKLTIAIADPASVIHCGDILDKEAMRRGTTVYLPTQTVLMLPECISCDIASLTAEEVRSSLVIRVWMNEKGKVTKSDISREPIQVMKRLHYSDADKLIEQGEDETAQRLRELLICAKLLFAQRQAEGAIILQRPEYKISVNQGTISVTMIERESPSRLLVAEMMILSNHVAAKYAYRHNIPFIYRVQDPPLQPITQSMIAEPLGFHKIRKLLGRSSLSLQPRGHSGLGLSMYTQLSSPLRRFADLVMQRQLMAHFVEEELPYDDEELLKVLETAERTTREARSIEGEAKKRWLMQYLKQNWGNKPLDALVLSEAKSGYKVEMQPWGVEAFLATSRSLEISEIVVVVTDKVRVKAGTVRLKLNVR
ncbi:ribonuclease catalytic domain-containing protein [Candidatus Parabeggiatoa sp. HSG14]|uniref:ribonuclease catalytic domain-containing protein n=1 Tax=Candidatus Parabeggiatoa sp. HSG14 TaxID=3055593 RepID=UPI0025A69129|nr:ribonuclease catalytic domain-containing protein [Thiotrichales bacterium HSG14]